MSKERKLIFCFKLDPYFKLDAAGKVKIPSGGHSPEHLWYPLYMLPFPKVQDCLPVPVPDLLGQNNSSHQGIRKPVLAKEKKGQQFGLSPGPLSLHFCKTSQLIGHRWSYKNSRENSLHAKLHIFYHLLIQLYRYLLTPWKESLNKTSKYPFSWKSWMKKKKPCYPFTWLVFHQWAALQKQQMWVGGQN